MREGAEGVTCLSGACCAEETGCLGGAICAKR